MNNLFLGHPRIWFSCVAGGALFFFLPRDWSTLSRILVCWNGGGILFLALIFIWMTRLTPPQIRTPYIEEDETPPFIFIPVGLSAGGRSVSPLHPAAPPQHGR